VPDLLGYILLWRFAANCLSVLAEFSLLLELQNRGTEAVHTDAIKVYFYWPPVSCGLNNWGQP
jgi:hypothetical protein